MLRVTFALYAIRVRGRLQCTALYYAVDNSLLVDGWLHRLNERTKRGIVGGLATAIAMITASVIYLAITGASLLGILFVVALEIAAIPLGLLLMMPFIAMLPKRDRSVDDR
jgi:hypothetical protein